MVGTGTRGSDNREREVQVGMLPLCQHSLGIALSVIVVSRRGEQIRGERHGHGHLPAARRTAEQQRVRQSLFLHQLHQPRFRPLLSYHLIPVHNL